MPGARKGIGRKLSGRRVGFTPFGLPDISPSGSGLSHMKRIAYGLLSLLPSGEKVARRVG
jgi:hypothetical protein